MISPYANPSLEIHVLGNIYAKSKEKSGPELFFPEIGKKKKKKTTKHQTRNIIYFIIHLKYKHLLV